VSSHWMLKILIEDVNDNRPKFPTDEITMSVPENTPINARYAVEQSAVDPDLGPHGVQTYWLVNDFGMFTLDVEENEGGELTPFLIVTEALDRETQAEYITDIIAEDGGTPPLLGTFLKVQVLDENDNAPVFQQSLVEISVEENNPPNTFLTQLQASDQDSESRGEVLYLLGGDAPGIFVVDRVTGILTVATSLDREEKETYRLIVRAVDQGTPRREAIATVVVTVQDPQQQKITFSSLCYWNCVQTCRKSYF
uniref:Cadherin domain-containing protein n=1 Tax=Oreochromis aureus TaxID=47969 RepID=A0A668RZD6_OREAU